jgi:hypothetical protein
MSKDADKGMLGVHAALVVIWILFTLKDYAQAGAFYLSQRKEDINDVSEAILTYAKLQEGRFGSSRSKDNEAADDSRIFVRGVNDDLIRSLDKAVTLSGLPKLNAHEIYEIEELLSKTNPVEAYKSINTICQERCRMSKTGLLTTAAVVGSAAAIGGAVAIPVSESATAAIATAATGAGIASLAGGFLSAGALNSKKILRNFVNEVESLIAASFGNDPESIETARRKVREDIKDQETRLTTPPRTDIMPYGISDIKQHRPGAARSPE